MAKTQNFSNYDNIRPIESIKNQEYYHVILLIDSSESMLFPFLKDKSNWHNKESEDYNRAIRLTQDKMIEAHEKALKALRGSISCNECFLKITQYTFSSAKKQLNDATELSSIGHDSVTKLTVDNYKPYNGTALYNTIHEALNLVFNKHLKIALDESKRVDKVTIGVITDGEDTVIHGYEKETKISEIKLLMKTLRGDEKYTHLVSSVLIGLTSDDFSIKKLNEVKEDLGFDFSVSITKSDEKAIRKAFKLFSTEAAQP